MKQLEKKDLIKDEIYKHENGNLVKYQFDGDLNGKIKGSYIGNNASRFCKEPDNNFTISYLKLATPEEKHWLEVCIAANSFISYKEAMKTFIPEYVECIKIDCKLELNTIYKVINSDKWSIPSNGNPYVVYLDSQNLKGATGPFYLTYFKPSTKEAYDAQFVVKEPEFVLPEIWWVRITKKNLKDVSKFLNDNIGEYTIGFVAGMVKSYKSGAITKGYNSTPTTSYGSTFGNEITFDQFKKYVLKENTTVTEKPKVVLEEPKDKVLSSMKKNFESIIHTVESSEGAIFELGDKIKVFTKDSKNKGKLFTIKSFRWNNAKTNICAITELHSKNGIGLDKIELYLEPKVKQPLFKTEDGVDIFEDDKFYKVGNYTNWNIHLVNVDKNIFLIREVYINNKNPKEHFSTKEKAEEYVLLNKPCLSLKEVLDVLKLPLYKNHSNKKYIEELTKLTNTKING